MEPTAVSIVIVNYRVRYFLEQTIRSAQEALQGIGGEIIVIDNNSQDGSIEYIKSLFPGIIIIENKENAGFGKANNQGFAIAKGEYTLILNPDTIIGKDSIADCIRFYNGHPDCGAIGVSMHDGNGVFLPESKRSFPTPWVSFCKIFGLSSLFPRSRTFAKYHLRYLPADAPHSIDILSGAFTFVKTDLLRKINGFDEDFFMYGEDIDLSFRIAKAGYRNYYIPTPIIHYKGESTQKGSYKYVRVFYEAMLIFFRKHYPHYSRFYGFFIRFAIRLRLSISMTKRFIKKLLPTREIAEFKYDNVILITRNGKELCSKISTASDNLLTFTECRNAELPECGDNLIVLDNRVCTYNDIIRFICQNSKKGRDFATYLSQAGKIILPKMD